jgi:HlyD family secretion protein
MIARNPRTTPRSGLQLVSVLVLLALGGGTAWLVLNRETWMPAANAEPIRGATVQRGPMKITVVERGNLKAADAVSLKNEIEGRTTILKLIPEGTNVQKGDLVCELDASELVDKRFEQEIKVRNAEAALVKSRQNLEIQKSQNTSDIKKAEQEVAFAEMDLRKFREGERLARQAEGDEAIKLAEEEYTRAEEKLAWSERLNEKGFLTDTELEADRLSLSRAQINREQAKRDKELLDRFQDPRDEAELVAQMEESKRELERVNLQASARLVDYEADLSTNEAKLRLERETLQKLTDQIDKAKLYAPRGGMVVYAVEERGRYGGGDPIQEGTEVRERQEIITIPSAGGMVAEVSLHESVLKQVQVGQAATIRVDALTDREFAGRVRFVAPMADQNSFWANPNLRLYRTQVTIDDPAPDMRPGMSCAIEIKVEDIADTIFVPVQAVYRRGKENLAFVDASGSIETRTVEVGRYNDRWVEVVAGLTEGETVLLSPPPGFDRTIEETIDDAPDGAAETSEAAPVAGRTPGGPGAASPGAQEEGRPRGPGGEGFDPQRAEEMRKRFENMSEDERAKMRESFRNRSGGERGGGGGERSGGQRGGGDRTGGERTGGGRPGGEAGRERGGQ